VIVGKDILLTVDDEGVGIPPEQRQAMLAPFSRLETSRNRGTGGAGLGLAIARGLIEAPRWQPVDRAGRSGGARISVRIRCSTRTDGSPKRRDLRQASRIPSVPGPAAAPGTVFIPGMKLTWE
jgi:K+-sensing histidine kinase KdpD